MIQFPERSYFRIIPQDSRTDFIKKPEDEQFFGHKSKFRFLRVKRHGSARFKTFSYLSRADP